MCRHLAYVGSPLPLRTLLFDAPHSLCAQARHPRHQTSGHENPHGWGTAWWAEGASAPERYRTVTPMWIDDGFAGGSTTPVTAALAAARRASPGTSIDEHNNAPFVSGRWAFSLNGFGFHDGRAARLRSALSARRAPMIEGDTDAELLFALVLDGLDAGASPTDALGAVVALVQPDATTRLNLLLTDGTQIAATRFGNSLFVRRGDAITVASEPLDDDAAWQEVPEGSILAEGPA